jgi:hypothetical protein
LIRRARNILATAGSVAILAGGMALAGAGTASAQTLPSCASGVNCASNFMGAAGYNGADDNHTHYRYVQTETTAAPQLVNLNGTGNNRGSTGVSLCDENTGSVAQLSLGFNGTAYQIAYNSGHYALGAADPCIQNAGSHIDVFLPSQTGNLLQFTGITKGDKIFLSIAYTPGRHPSIQFSAADITTSVFRSATVKVSAKSFTEFGIGAFTRHQHLTAPPNNPLAAFLLNQVRCYSCGGNVPITSVSPVNPFNIGGLYESQLINISSQPTMSPLDSLAVSTDAFGVQNGSTSS